MGYNRDAYRKVKLSYDGKNLKAKNDAERRAEELRRLFPEIKEIDDALSETGMKFFEVASKGGENMQKALSALREETDALYAARKECLAFNGYPTDYSDVKYECKLCSDTGYVGINMCKCMREKIIEETFIQSGIGKLMKTQTFESFKPELQCSDPRTLENTKMIYEFCKSYAEKFGRGGVNMNLLFIGATGLGKTHLSTSIAKRVIENGYDVIYETSQNIFGDFEFERFNRGYASLEEEPSHTDKYFSCDLLIIDDLGTEMINQFTVSCLYNIINTRINHEKATIINTNFSRDELTKKYSERIASRLFGEFFMMPFFGRDARELKINS